MDYFEDFNTEIYPDFYEEDKWIRILHTRNVTCPPESFLETCIARRMDRVLRTFLSKTKLPKNTDTHQLALDPYWRTFTASSIIDNILHILMENNFSFNGRTYIITGSDRVYRLFPLYLAGIQMKDVHNF